MRLFANRIERVKGKWALWRWYDVFINGDLYLTRLQLVKTPWFSVKLHWIHKPDPDRELHDHPWPFMSFVLKGGYNELESHDPANQPGELKTINWFNYKNTITAHRIVRVKPNTITLVFTGPRLKDWGFYDDKTLEFTNWQEYQKVKHS